MQAPALLDRLHTVVRDAPPPGLAANDVDAFLRRNRAVLLALITERLADREPDLWTPAKRTRANLAGMEVLARGVQGRAARVPDRARLVINCLLGCLNPEKDYLPYCLTDLTGSPPRSISAGAIIEVIRTPGGAAPKPPGFRSSSPSMLLSMIPVPGTTTPELDPLEPERLAMPPSASTALTWVVDPVGLREGGGGRRLPSSAQRDQMRSMQSSWWRSSGNASSRSALAAAPARATAR